MKRTFATASLLLLACLAPAQAQTPIAPTAPSTSPLPAPVLRDVDPENVLVIDTNKGRIIAELTPFTAPNHVERIRTLTRQGFYNGRAFFRVIDEFMAQTGDPLDTGTGGSDLPDLAEEFFFRRGADLPYVAIGRTSNGMIGTIPVSTQPDAQMLVNQDGKVTAMPHFCSGVIGMARGGDPNSANSQFFFMRQPTPRLNSRYTVLGRVLTGLDVVRSIKTGEPVPDPQDKMLTVRVLADIPAAERPKVQALVTTGPAFAAYAARIQGEKGLSFTLCDLDTTTPVK